MPIASRLAQTVPRDMGRLGVCALYAALLGAVAPQASALPAQDEPVPLSLYGTPGGIDTPTARFMEDGDLAITGETKKPDDRITIDFQALPWLETTARYSIISNFAGPKQALYDRSLGIKAGLIAEGEYRPALAVGIQDIGGTEVFGGEYFVASKRLGPFDTSLGLGFGRLGSDAMFANPFGAISKSFYNRTDTGTGQPALKDFFHGHDASLFGGVVYNAPLPGLQLLAEYSGDKYTAEQRLGLIKVKSQVNYGVSYRPWRFLELGGYWTYGSRLALRISLRQSLPDGDERPKLDPPPPPIHVRTDDEISRGELNLAPLGGLASPVPGSKGANGLLERFNRDGLSNGPDFDIDDAGPIVWEAAAEVSDFSTDNAQAIAHIRAQLDSLGMKLAHFGIDDTQAVISVVPSGGQAPLPCEVMWHQISVGNLNGVTAVTFINSAGGHEINRCTKFIDANQAEAAQANGPDAQNSLASNDEGADTLVERLRRVFAYQGLSLEAFKLNGTEAIVYLNNVSYQRVGRALGRAARALTELLPPKIDMLTIIETNGTVMGAKFAIPRTALERAEVTGATVDEILNDTAASPASPTIVAHADYKRDRVFNLHPLLAPAFRPSLFDPDNPFRYQFLIRAGGSVELMRGISIDAVYDINLYNDFNQIKRVSDSQLPHVRSDFKYYLQQGSTGIESLQLNLIHQFAPAWTTRLSAGYLEQMFGGVAGEVLYAPFRQRWAIGLDVAAVKQRDYDELFGFRRYSTVTGHLELYYQTPFHDIDLHFLYGRYLARDWGTTVEVSRRFDNGAEVSAYATFTNVPFAKFGEGSFDKGIKITIPFDFYSLYSTRQSTTVELKPLTRDGGAILNDYPKLYPIVRSLSYGEAYRTFDDFLADR